MADDKENPALEELVARLSETKGEDSNEGKLIRSLLRSAAERELEARSKRLSGPELGELLVKRLAALNEDHAFQAGDLVMWKPALKNKKKPYDGQPAIAVQILDEPVIDQQEGSGSSYFREPLDMTIGLLADDGDFVIYHVDSRRFKPYQPQEDE